MSGAPILEIRNLLLPCFDQITVDGPIFAFDDHCEHLTERKQLENLTGRGGTSFLTALTNVSQYLRQSASRLRFADVLFFTDGQDASIRKNKAFLDSWFGLMEALQARLHVVGYSRSHDLETMKCLAGPVHLQNSYQYCPNVASLTDAFHNIFEYNQQQSSNTVHIRLMSSTLNGVWSKVIELQLPDDGQEGEEDALLHIFVPAEITERISAELVSSFDEESSTKTESRPTKNHGVDEQHQNLTVVVQQVPSSFKDEVLYLDELLTNCDQDNVDGVREIDQKLTACLNKIQKKTDGLQDRRSCMFLILSLKSKVAERYSKISKKAPTFSSSTSTNSFDEQAFAFAASRALPSKNRYRRNLEKKLAIAQDKSILKSKQAVQEALDQGLVTPWSSSPLPPSPLDFLCEMSLLNCDELASTGDCLCITLTVDRQQASIQVPSLVYVQNIGQNFYSFQIFRQLANNMVQNHDTSLIDFSKLLGTHLLSDRVLKPFNAVFPVFLHDGHWAVARHFLELACGWIVAFDERVGAPSQILPIVCCLANAVFRMKSSSSSSTCTGGETIASEKHQVAVDALWKTLRRLHQEFPKYFQSLREMMESTIKACATAPPRQEQGDGSREEVVDGIPTTSTDERSHMDELKINKTQIPNLDALMGALALAHDEPWADNHFVLSPLERRVLFAETQRRLFKRHFIDGNHVMLGLKEAFRFSEKPDGPFGFLWDKYPFVPAFDIDARASELTHVQKQALAAWAIFNSWSDQPNEWTCDYGMIFYQPERVLSEIFARAQEHQKKILAGLTRLDEALARGYNWIVGESIALPFNSHIFEGSLLGYALKAARTTKVHRGPEKLRWLMDHGVQLAYRNYRQFL